MDVFAPRAHRDLPVSGRSILAALLGAGAAALLVASACSTTPTTTAGGDFNGPVGLAVTWGQDRDLLFISNTAGDELRALNVCTSVSGPSGLLPLPDGGVDPGTCTPSEAFQFVPGPIRVFPGSVLVGNRPARIAGVRLLDSNQAPVGAVVVAGAEPALRLVDANNVLAAARRLPGVTPAPAQKIVLPLPAVDVVASDQPAHRVRAFALTASPPGPASMPAITAFDVTVVNGAPQVVAMLRCSLDFVATRLALVPGPDDLISADAGPRHLYVADGTLDGTPGGRGDGAVEVSVPDIPVYDANAIPACPPSALRRLPASDPADQPYLARPLRSLALSPTFYKKSATAVPDPVAGGAYLMGATLANTALCGPLPVPSPPPVPVPSDARTHASLASDPTCGAGRIVFVKTNVGVGPSQVARAPRAFAVDLLNQPPGDPPMAPLRPPSPAREVAFFLPRPGCLDESGVPRESGFCTDLAAGSPGTGLTIKPKQIQLGAVAALEDGGAAYISASDLRFINDQFDTSGTSISPALTAPTLAPAVAPGQEVPLLAFPNDASFYAATGLVNPCPGPDTSTPGPVGCMTLGVSRTIRWRLVWRAVIPGLETVAGIIRRDSASTLRLQLPAGKTLTPWIASPTLQLQPGDVVRIIGFAFPASGPPCPELTSFARTLDLKITAVEPGALVFATAKDPGNGANGAFVFDPPATCPIDGLGAALEVHTGSPAAGEWLVFAGQDVRGRVPHDHQFVGLAQRFDYPPAGSDPPPPLGIEIAFAPTGTTAGRTPDITGQFLPLGLNGGADGTSFTFATASNDTPTTVRDLATFQGFADGMLAYQNRNALGGLLYVALTGANSLLQVSPGNIGREGAIAVYR